jgi:hypothetical protein
MTSKTKKSGRDAYAQRVALFLDRHRIGTYHFEYRAKHRAVVVEHDGKVTTVIFPASGSDWRGPRNAISSLRRALGLGGAQT